ncbi:MAG: N-acetylmuramoyl-L-alanine amidase [Planctomycetia bacterium]|nr:N-acetylmuramoyl-L-alanine amidase [Planctomycetia bacterium]
MEYTNSPMVVYTKLSPNHSGQRTHSIDRITPHCVVGQCTAEGLGEWFAKSSTQASSNYGIDRDGRVAMYVEEKNRSWCSSSNANDQRAVTIECASDTKEPYAFRDIVYKTLVKLCVDICKRYDKSKLLWLEDKDKTLAYEPKPEEMILTVHRWFANKSCPGNWMFARMGDLAEKVTAILEGRFESVDDLKDVSSLTTTTPFLVKVNIDNLNIRKGPGTSYERTQFIPVGVYTIVEVKSGADSVAGWGRLCSGAGWISLDYCNKLS